MPKDIRIEPLPDRVPSVCARVGRPLAWVLPALLALCATGFALSPGVRDSTDAGKAQQSTTEVPPDISSDAQALQHRIAELDKQVDTVNAAMSRLIVVMQRRDEQNARSIDRIAELHQHLNTLVRHLKHRDGTRAEPPSDP